MKLKSLTLAVTLITVAQLAGFAASAAETSTTRMNGTQSNEVKTNEFGLGAQWGALTGISGKFWTNEMEAVSAGVAFQDGNTAVNADYLYHFREGLSSVTNSRSARTVVPYVGGGLIAAFGSNTNFFYHNTDRFGLAARIPLGLEFLPRTVPIGIFGEVVPSFAITPTNFTFLTADLGARYYF